MLRVALSIQFSQTVFGASFGQGHLPDVGYLENKQEDVLGLRDFEAHGEGEIHEAREESHVEKNILDVKKVKMVKEARHRGHMVYGSIHMKYPE